MNATAAGLGLVRGEPAGCRRVFVLRYRRRCLCWACPADWRGGPARGMPAPFSGAVGKGRWSAVSATACGVACPNGNATGCNGSGRRLMPEWMVLLLGLAAVVLVARMVLRLVARWWLLLVVGIGAAVLLSNGYLPI